jgi:hypothetical protein
MGVRVLSRARWSRRCRWWGRITAPRRRSPRLVATCRTSSGGSRGLAVVVVEQVAEPVAPAHRPVPGVARRVHRGSGAAGLGAAAPGCRRRRTRPAPAADACPGRLACQARCSGSSDRQVPAWCQGRAKRPGHREVRPEEADDHRVGQQDARHHRQGPHHLVGAMGTGRDVDVEGTVDHLPGRQQKFEEVPETGLEIPVARLRLVARHEGEVGPEEGDKGGAVPVDQPASRPTAKT